MNRYENIYDDYYPNQHGLGTPTEQEKIKAVRLEKKFRKVCKIVAFVLVLAVVFMAGLSARESHEMVPTTKQPVDVYRQKAAKLLAGQSRFELDRLNCLVGIHKDATGQIVVSEHC